MSTTIATMSIDDPHRVLLSAPHGSGSGGTINPPTMSATSSSSPFAPFTFDQNMGTNAEHYALPSGGTSSHNSLESQGSALVMAATSPSAE